MTTCRSSSVSLRGRMTPSKTLPASLTTRTSLQTRTPQLPELARGRVPCSPSASSPRSVIALPSPCAYRLTAAATTSRGRRPGRAEAGIACAQREPRSAARDRPCRAAERCGVGRGPDRFAPAPAAARRGPRPPSGVGQRHAGLRPPSAHESRPRPPTAPAARRARRKSSHQRSAGIACRRRDAARRRPLSCSPKKKQARRRSAPASATTRSTSARAAAADQVVDGRARHAGRARSAPPAPRAAPRAPPAAARPARG